MRQITRRLACFTEFASTATRLGFGSLSGFALWFLVSFPGTVAASEPFPTRPIRVIIPFGAGNAVEAMMRQVGEKFRESTGQAFVLDARPGASGNIAAEAVARAEADGYTLLAATQGIMTINPHLFAKMTFDPIKDFSPITLVGQSQTIFFANQAAPGNSLSDFIAWAKANPGKLAYASNGAGTPSHFSGMLLNQEAGLDLLHIPYKSTGAAMTDLVANRVVAGFLAAAFMKPLLASGKVKALAVASARRSAVLPEVPTFKELGFPSMQTSTWAGLAAPAKTPLQVTAKLNAEVTRALALEEVRRGLAAMNQDASPMSQADFQNLIKEDSERWARVIKISGFKLEQ